MRLRNFSQRIEHVFATHNIPSVITGGVIGPRHVVFHLRTPLSVDPRKLEGYEAAVAKALCVQSCRIARDKDVVLVEVPRSNAEAITLDELLPVTSTGAAELPTILGRGIYGHPIVLDLASPSVAHALVAGTTGSGKTRLVQTMILSLATLRTPDQVGVVIIDPKGEYQDFRGLPHLARDISEYDYGVLGWLVSLMESRTTSNPGTPIVCFIDELADVIMIDPVAKERITRLTQRGRGVGVHVVACTQKPTASAIGSLVKTNFPTRIVGKFVDARDSQVAGGLPKLGAENLNGPGDFIIVGPVEPRRFSAAIVPDTRRAIEQLRGRALPEFIAPDPRGPLDRFIGESCILEPEAEAKASELYSAFTANGSCMTLTKFGIEMGKRFEKISRRDGNYYRGLRLN